MAKTKITNAVKTVAKGVAKAALGVPTGSAATDLVAKSMKKATASQKGVSTMAKRASSAPISKPAASTAKKASSSMVSGAVTKGIGSIAKTATPKKSMAKKAIRTTTSTGQKIPNATSKSGRNRVKDLW